MIVAQGSPIIYCNSTSCFFAINNITIYNSFEKLPIIGIPIYVYIYIYIFIYILIFIVRDWRIKKYNVYLNNRWLYISHQEPKNI
jgi:hypothetical protein